MQGGFWTPKQILEATAVSKTEGILSMEVLESRDERGGSRLMIYSEACAVNGMNEASEIL